MLLPGYDQRRSGWRRSPEKAGAEARNGVEQDLPARCRGRRRQQERQAEGTRWRAAEGELGRRELAVGSSEAEKNGKAGGGARELAVGSMRSRREA